jgi:hypothetical protein
MSGSRYVLLASFLFLILASVATGDETENQNGGPALLSEYNLKSSVIGSAGAPATNAEYRVAGTLGQPTPIGIATGSPGNLYAGFWWRPWSTASVLATHGDEVLADRLLQSYPNPFAGSTVIAYSTAAPGHVDITVFNVMGRRVRCLVSEDCSAGRHEVTWDGRDEGGARVSPGVYFYRFKTGSFDSVRKMLVLK